jgi:hypothetical protein
VGNPFSFFALLTIKNCEIYADVVVLKQTRNIKAKLVIFGGLLLNWLAR